MKANRLFVVIMLAWAVNAGGQYTKEFQRIFFDADYLYITGFYEEALNRYKNLLRLDPDNDNLKFRCGSCCLRIQGLEMEAIPYLADAAGNVSLSYDENSEKETAAPVLTWFMLGRAYHMDSRFGEAREFYTKYIEASANEDPLQAEYARLQVLACDRAERLVGRPARFLFESVLDRFDADLPSSGNPVVSGDGSVLIFLVDFPSDKKIMMTTKEGDYFREPWEINSQIGMVGETYPASLSYDGKELYIVHEYYSHSDILVSRFENGRWTEVELLNHNINKRSSENHASISKDGQRLYFASDRRGGEGSFDIYVSEVRPGKGWGAAENLGPVINTPLEEQTPFIAGNDSLLFFSSQGHGSFGGFDVFVSELREDGTWTEPENAGYPVSTTGEDLFFNPGWDDLAGYYAVRKASDPGSNTINLVMEISPGMQAEIIETVGPVEVEIIAEKLQRVTFGQQEVPAVEPALFIQPEQADAEEIMPEPGRHEAISAEPAETMARGADGPSVEGKPAGKDQLYRATRQPAGGADRYEAGIPFDYNKYNLNLAAVVELERIAELMRLHPSSRAEITGHADSKGALAYNLLLSHQRADGVARALAGKGIDPGRIAVSGRGESAPLARNRNPDGSDAPAGRFINRQATVIITGLDIRNGVYGTLFVPASLKPLSGDPAETLNPGERYTIQVGAHRRPADMEQYGKLNGVRSVSCRDGYIRYICGEFSSFAEANEALRRIQQTGYRDAFIQLRTAYK